MSDQSERMADAIQQALNSRDGNLLVIAKRYYSELKGNGYLKKCPFCSDPGQTFGVKMSTGGHWYWGCRVTTCEANIDTLKQNRQADTIGFIMHHERISRQDAVDKLLSMTGVANPREQRKPTSRKKSQKESKPGETKEATTSKPTSSPVQQEEHASSDDKPDNIIGFSLTSAEPPQPPDDRPISVWDRIWNLLSLSSAHRESMKRKRGFTSEAIAAHGFRSSTKENRTILQPLISEFDEEILLSEGIAIRTKGGDLMINSQLCGYGLKSRGKRPEDDVWDWTSPILIPYFDRDGSVICIRPHKGGLSGKRWMVEQGYEQGFRSTRTRTRPYVTPIVWTRPESWDRTCVLTEGEFKAVALAQCGIPAVATPGIQMLRNKIFLEQLVETLRAAGIHDVIVVYDNEDKSHKTDPWTRYEAAVYARYACHALRNEGFRTSYTDLPDDWRVEGKADWDGALARYGSKSAGMFHEVLKGAKRYYPQTELFGFEERERIIQCKLNKLTLDPTILTGGDEEEELARLILRTPKAFRSALHVSELARELFDTRGCYYVRKRPSEKRLQTLIDYQDKIREELESTPRRDLDQIASLEAALAAVDHSIEGRPEILSDFTISCDFQLRTQEGDVCKLFRFKNKHGQVSEQLISIPPSAQSTSTKFREFCMSKGNFNPMIGDKQLQQLMIELGTFSAWREIRQLEMIGEDPNSKLWIFGDCAFGPNGQVIFADNDDIIWHEGIGYRIDIADLRGFAHREPPKFFQKLGKEPYEVLAEINADPEKERAEVGMIFLQLAADMIATFGDASGLHALATVLAYAASPELLAKYHMHPGLWIHGRAYAGKTETTRAMMQIWGFPAEYRTAVLSGGTTDVAIDRALAQYSNIPCHLDEFRQDEVSKTRNSSLRTPFNRQAKQKGMFDSTNRTRAVQPMTSPIVTGEGVTNDSATLSRYVEVILAKDKRLGTPTEQSARFQRMLSDSAQYHRIARWLLMNRKWFGSKVLETLDQFVNEPAVCAAVKSDRIRLVYGTSHSVYEVLLGHFLSTIPDEYAAMMDKQDWQRLKEHSQNDKRLDFTLTFAQRASTDVASINFVVKFWDAVMTAYARGFEQIRNFIKFERCKIDPDTNKVTILQTNEDIEGSVRCVIAVPGPLYAEYEKDARQRGHSPELSLSNIRAEAQTERYWVPAPKGKNANRSHRPTLDKLGQVSVWVLRWDLMEPALQERFVDQFEKNSDEEEKQLGL